MRLARGRALWLISAAVGGALAGCGEPPSAASETPGEIAALVVTPGTLTVKSTAPTTAVLAWTDGSPDESGFEVWRSTTGATGSYTLRATTAANAIGYQDTGLSEGTQYCYKVRALESAGGAPSAFSNSACDITTPNRPTNFVATATGGSTIGLTWRDNSAKETGFELWRSTTGISGSYARLATLPVNATSAVDAGLAAAKQYCYRLRATGAGAMAPSPYSTKSCATTLASVAGRVVLFGDSNTDTCMGQTGSKYSYVSLKPALTPAGGHLACQLAGKVQAKWSAVRTPGIRVVNHAIASTATGGGGFGWQDRSAQGSPNARTLVNGITRFEAEVLGQGYPWSGGEPVNQYFPNGAVTRINAFTPGANDFAYVSMGTNDAASSRNMTPAQTEANLRWMVQRWLAAGRAADHFILTTLAPRAGASSATAIPDRNALIRALAAELGVHLVDLAAYTSNDDGRTWKSASLHIGDGIHYTESVRAWIADRIVAHLTSEIPASP